jgi:hypothetical protein
MKLDKNKTKSSGYGYGVDSDSYDGYVINYGFGSGHKSNGLVYVKRDDNAYSINYGFGTDFKNYTDDRDWFKK